MTLFLMNARIVDPEAGEVCPGDLVLDSGVIAAMHVR